jgi:Tfp pilus assembly protein PilX
MDEGGDMAVGWILLALVSWALISLFTLVLFRMAGDQDRVARHNEKRFLEYSDVTITQFGH